MFITSQVEQVEYTRTSKLGIEHKYTRNRTWNIFHCDSCGSEFKRLQGSMDPKRLNNNYFHCCNLCNSKKFAQRKGVERKKIWDMPASSTLPINRF
jgi:hypothetical protein